MCVCWLVAHGDRVDSGRRGHGSSIPLDTHRKLRLHVETRALMMTADERIQLVSSFGEVFHDDRFLVKEKERKMKNDLNFISKVQYCDRHWSHPFMTVVNNSLLGLSKSTERDSIRFSASAWLSIHRR